MSWGVGCFHDHGPNTVCDLPCIPRGSSGGCSNPCPRKHAGCATRHGGKFTCDPPFTRMTLDACNKMCAGMGARYFGTQAGHACFCGDSFGSQGRAASDSMCSTRCAGNSSEVCGGPDLNSVYNVSAG